MNELKIAEQKGLQDVKAFQLNDDDTVAAYTLEEAKKYYQKITGLDDEDAFRDPCERSLDAMIWEDEHMKNKISIREAIQIYWEGEPFIIASSEW
jgi:hypothetical protein